MTPNVSVFNAWLNDYSEYTIKEDSMYITDAWICWVDLVVECNECDDNDSWAI